MAMGKRIVNEFNRKVEDTDKDKRTLGVEEQVELDTLL